MLDWIRIGFGIALALIAGVFALVLGAAVVVWLMIAGVVSALTFRHALRPASPDRAVIDGECREVPGPNRER